MPTNIEPFNTTIQTFLYDASSAAPTPGGGSVAALVAALGASMTSMVANLTQGPKFIEVEVGMVELVNSMKSVIARFEELFAADVNSFNLYMEALKLPKTTDEEKSARHAALQSATIAATEVPITLATECLHALTSTHGIADTANKQVLSDLGIAAMLLHTAGQSALMTADINIPSIKDESTRAKLAGERDYLSHQLNQLREDTLGVVSRRMKQS